jgi:hypothetical protein
MGAVLATAGGKTTRGSEKSEGKKNSKFEFSIFGLLYFKSSAC